MKAGRRWAPLLLVLLGFALRVHHLGAQELRGDEAFGYFFSLQAYDEILRATLALHEPHPVASYFAQKWWLGLAGDSEFAVRFVSAWWGTLAVALLYRLGRRLLLGRHASSLAALLLAISPYALWHSQDARMYSMSLALTLTSTWLAFEGIQRRRWSRRAGLLWISYVAVTWLALQTHYFAVFVLLAQNAFIIPLLLWPRRRPAILLAWVCSQAAVGLLTLPWFILARNTLLGYGGNGDSPSFGSMLLRSFGAFAVGETTPVEQRVVFAVLAGFLVSIGVARLLLARPSQRQAAAFLLLYLSVPLLATWIGALQRPIFDERYLVAAAPPFYLLLASSVTVLAGRPLPSGVASELQDSSRRLSRALERTAVGLTVVVLLVVQAGAVLAADRYYAGSASDKMVGWRELAAMIDRLSAGLPPEQVRIAQNYPDPSLWYYYRGPITHIVLPPRALNAELTEREVTLMVEAGVRWVILPVQLAPVWDDRGIASEILARSYERIIQSVSRSWPIEVYVRPPEELQAIEAHFVDLLTLKAATVEPLEVPAGGAVAVHLRWGGLSGVSGGEKITIQVLDSDGRLVAQTDQPLGADQLSGRIASYGILLPETGLSPGDYRVIMAVYAPGQPGAPRLRTVQGSDFVTLATIRVF